MSSLREWSGEPKYSYPTEEYRPRKIGHTFFLGLPINKETMEFDVEQRRLWKMLDAARGKMPRDFTALREIQDNINAHLVQYDEPPVEFPPLKRTLREGLIISLQKFNR